ncbi:phosphoribosylformylglycinamidine cyclo-ligase [Anaerobranca gottschalkii]|uniref:Phosphoribosylformylglycinamidine cyclo-ligase n=1 Tax=Anaerobranca gottschalkii DSM 13577 TaxID=1120990 RepID=A0A1I0AQ73_9FIRM|nr:phosphoribosylformylglycinamidine cyclo-ligase [Anaerobranca gottschalkii]SES96453.1 phosphoribosylformylglycinamidine cyclo-ligase [Anaerobranca gottschalkii DSM 13577]
MKFSYKGSGVDIQRGNSLIPFYKECGEKTKIKGVLGSIGGFGGLFKIPQGYKSPVLVSATDGVGTKLELAIKYNAHEVVGKDLVAMCVNDIITCGAKPLFFLDYLATGELEEETIKSFMTGVTEGCKVSGCALLGGETAEMPKFYPRGKYDVAGFCVGIVEEGEIIDGSQCQKGDLVIGLFSTGIHSNGFSLVRNLLEHFPQLEEYMDEILQPTALYPPVVNSLLEGSVKIHGMAHITGGGLIENIPRVIPKDLDCIIQRGSWEIPELFIRLQSLGQIDEIEMFTTFNMGIGYVLIIPPEERGKVEEILAKNSIGYRVIGFLSSGNNKVVLR